MPNDRIDRSRLGQLLKETENATTIIHEAFELNGVKDDAAVSACVSIVIYIFTKNKAEERSIENLKKALDECARSMRGEGFRTGKMQ